ncbi:hypothetical protein ACQPYK_50065 (plasmid) [Streptosporangium sp. CA-135522]|uniref:hypothetical protein n=1 Tax=Streptosporangium sp. CA-135522 TaxID=3240072 RepID=UPI003D8B5FAA
MSKLLDVLEALLVIVVGTGIVAGPVWLYHAFLADDGGSSSGSGGSSGAGGDGG